MEIACLIEGVEVKMLWDTGAQVSLISESWLQENFLPTEYTIRPVSELIDGEELSIEGAVAGSAIPYIGYTPLSFQLGRVQRQQLLVPFLVTTAKTSIPIVGSNVMQAVINTNNSTDLSLIKLTELGLNTDEVMAIKTVMHHQEEEHKIMTVKIPSDLTVPARSCTTVECRIEGSLEKLSESVFIFEPDDKWSYQTGGIEFYQSVVHPSSVNEVEITVINKSDKDLQLESNQTIGVIERAECSWIPRIEEKESNSWKDQKKQKETNMDKSKTKKRFNELNEETIEQEYASFFKTLKEKEFELLNKEETQEAKGMIWEENRGKYSGQNPE